MKHKGEIFRTPGEEQRYFYLLLDSPPDEQANHLRMLLANYDWYYREHQWAINWSDHLYTEDKIGLLLLSLPEETTKPIWDEFAPDTHVHKFEDFKKPYLMKELEQKRKPT